MEFTLLEVEVIVQTNMWPLPAELPLLKRVSHLLVLQIWYIHGMVGGALCIPKLCAS